MSVKTNFDEANRFIFEKWLAEVHMLSSEWQPARNCYKDFAAHLAWQAWQASQAASAPRTPCCRIDSNRDTKGDDTVKIKVWKWSEGRLWLRAFGAGQDHSPYISVMVGPVELIWPTP